MNFVHRNKHRRPSSDDISTPTSNRSRSSSLLSSEYIPEEDEDDIDSPPLELDKIDETLSRPSEALENESGAQDQEDPSNIDRLVKLVHELKEEDLNNHKRKIALKHRELESSGEEMADNLGDESAELSGLDLQKVLVPTIPQLINVVTPEDDSEEPRTSTDLP